MFASAVAWAEARTKKAEVWIGVLEAYALQAIAALPADERGRLTKDRDDALAVLLGSGHIDEAPTLDRAID